jgi:hypothetical protein
MDQHAKVDTLLSRAEVPIIDLSHMGECLTFQLPRVLHKKLDIRHDSDGVCFS